MECAIIKKVFIKSIYRFRLFLLAPPLAASSSRRIVRSERRRSFGEENVLKTSIKYLQRMVVSQR